MDTALRWLLAVLASVLILALALLAAYGIFLLLRLLGRFAILAGLLALPLLWMARRWNRTRRRAPPPRIRSEG